MTEPRDPMSERLVDAGARWRAATPAPPVDVEESLAQGPSLRRRWPLVLTAAAVVALIIALVTVLAPSGKKPAPTDGNSHGVVPWKPLPATGARIPMRRVPGKPAHTYAVSAPPCRDGDVTLRGRPTPYGAGAGTVFDLVRIRSASGRTCRLAAGLPSVTATYRGAGVHAQIQESTPTPAWRWPVLVGPKHAAAFSVATTDVQWCARIDTLTAMLPGLHNPLSTHFTVKPLNCQRGEHDHIGISHLFPAGRTEPSRVSVFQGLRAAARALPMEHGAPERFDVTLRATHTIVLDPCPDYTMGMIVKRAPPRSMATYALNCAAIPTRTVDGRPEIKAHQPVTFEMQLPTLRPGAHTITWGLVGLGSVGAKVVLAGR